MTHIARAPQARRRRRRSRRPGGAARAGFRRPRAQLAVGDRQHAVRRDHVDAVGSISACRRPRRCRGTSTAAGPAGGSRGGDRCSTTTKATPGSSGTPRRTAAAPRSRRPRRRSQRSGSRGRRRMRLGGRSCVCDHLRARVVAAAGRIRCGGSGLHRRRSTPHPQAPLVSRRGSLRCDRAGGRGDGPGLQAPAAGRRRLRSSSARVRARLVCACCTCSARSEHRRRARAWLEMASK